MGSFGKEKTMADFRLSDHSVKLPDGKIKRSVVSEDDSIPCKALIRFLKHHLNLVI